MQRHSLLTYLRQIAITTLVFMFFGTVYLMIMWGPHMHALVVGTIWGLVVGLVGSAGDALFLSRISRKWSFGRALAAGTLFYLVLVSGSVFFVAVHHVSTMTGKSFVNSFSDQYTLAYLRERQYIRDLFFAFVIILFVGFVTQMIRLLGRTVFWNYITGRYHRPSREKRVVLFLDLISSTRIAEQHGPERFHAFLNEFFFDITPAITTHKGEIYQYVGDEVVITWKKDQGLIDAHCLRCAFDMKELIRQKQDKYVKHFGVVPEFKAGFHYGDLVVGEIGDVKREIAFHGDTMNTAARIRSACTEFHKEVLVSGELWQHLRGVSDISAESIGRLKLKGKERDVELYAVSR